MGGIEGRRSNLFKRNRLFCPSSICSIFLVGRATTTTTTTRAVGEGRWYVVAQASKVLGITEKKEVREAAERKGCCNLLTSWTAGQLRLPLSWLFVILAGWLVE